MFVIKFELAGTEIDYKPSKLREFSIMLIESIFREESAIISTLVECMWLEFDYIMIK